jgi:hypothetical protein
MHIKSFSNSSSALLRGTHVMAPARIIALIAATVCVTGCSSGPDETSTEGLEHPPIGDTEIEVVHVEDAAVEHSDELLSDLESEIEFQQLVRTPLSSSEREELESFLFARGYDLSQMRLVGRMLLVHDLYQSVDDLLEEARATIEKGFTYNGPATDSPDIFSRLNAAGAYEMRRPIGGSSGTALICGSTALRDIMTTATNAIESAANDCITGSTFQPMTTAQWNALMQGQAGYTQMSITRGPVGSVCPGSPAGTLACATTPRIKAVPLNAQGGFQNRMSWGGRIGLVDTEVIGTDSRSIGNVIHEVLHTMGVAHPTDGPRLRVVGTLNTGLAANPTIMGPGCSQASGAGCTSIDTLRPDDIDVIDTCYSPQGGGSCSFPVTFEVIAAVP